MRVVTEGPNSKSVFIEWAGGPKLYASPNLLGLEESIVQFTMGSTSRVMLCSFEESLQFLIDTIRTGVVDQSNFQQHIGW